MRISSCAHNWITHIPLLVVVVVQRKSSLNPHRKTATTTTICIMDDVKIEREEADSLQSKQTVRCNNIYSMILETLGCRLEADAGPSIGFGPAQLSPPPSSLVSLSSTFSVPCRNDSCTIIFFFRFR